MSEVGWFGAGLAVLTGAVAVFSLMTAVIPARWPMPAIARKDHPFQYWLTIGGYTLSALGGLSLAIRFIT